MPVEVKERQVDSVSVLELSGRLTMGAGSEARDERLQSLIAGGHRALLLDCRQGSAIDTQGIKALVRSVTAVEKQGGKLKLLNVSPRMRKVLDLTRLLTVIESFDDEAAARASF
ncbi:MAG: STAS domain-containing protein [Terriglobia bacterium]